MHPISCASGGYQMIALILLPKNWPPVNHTEPEAPLQNLKTSSLTSSNFKFSAPLSQGGEDTIAHAAALCPNCHREAHHG